MSVLEVEGGRHVFEGPRTTIFPFLDGLPEEVCHVVSLLITRDLGI